MWRKEVMADEPQFAEVGPDDLVYIVTTPAQLNMLAGLLAGMGIRLGRLPDHVAGSDIPAYIMSPDNKFFGLDPDA
jgi:hypothetical protein